MVEGSKRGRSGGEKAKKEDKEKRRVCGRPYTMGPSGMRVQTGPHIDADAQLLEGAVGGLELLGGGPHMAADQRLDREPRDQKGAGGGGGPEKAWGGGCRDPGEKVGRGGGV